MIKVKEHTLWQQPEEEKQLLAFSLTM